MGLKTEHAPDPFGPDFDRETLTAASSSLVTEWTLGGAVSISVETPVGVPPSEAKTKITLFAGGGIITGDTDDFRLLAVVLAEACDVAEEAGAS